MIIRPAIDLRDGQCVQLVGGSYDNELLRLPDPIAVAHDWIEKGFTGIHIIDLDRATGNGTNIETIQKLCAFTLTHDVNIRVGGGIREINDIKEVLSFGANSVVVGTRAILDPDWFDKAVEQFPEKIYVAVEVNERDVVIKGWQEKSTKTLEELIEQFSAKDIAGLFVTAVHKEGRKQGTDIDLFTQLRALTDKPIVASGGITTTGDIDRLIEVGIDEVVLGAAIYTVPELAEQLQDPRYSGRNS
jgi:phosphoribosylformimino-5-aminoimidazole carboxamide ribotide isomerase